MLHHFQKSWTPGFIQTSSRTSFGNSKEFRVFQENLYHVNHDSSHSLPLKQPSEEFSSINPEVLKPTSIDSMKNR